MCCLSMFFVLITVIQRMITFALTCFVTVLLVIILIGSLILGYLYGYTYTYSWHHIDTFNRFDERKIPGYHKMGMRSLVTQEDQDTMLDQVGLATLSKPNFTSVTDDLGGGPTRTTEETMSSDRSTEGEMPITWNYLGNKSDSFEDKT